MWPNKEEINVDVSLMIGDIKFNYRVATIIKNNDKILLHKSKDDNFYAIPGGRIKIGEDSVSALRREFLEEIGAELNVKDLAGMIENFYMYNMKKCHEIMLIYNSELKDTDFLNKSIIQGIEEDSKVDLVWKNIEDIKNIDFRPAVLKQHIINNENKFFHRVNHT